MNTSYDTWLQVGHVFGLILWVGMMIAVLNLLGADSAARPALGAIANKLARFMDIGAAVAIGFGVALLVTRINQAANPLKGAGYFHAKLAFAVALIGVHGYTRVQVKKLGRGGGGPVPVIVPTIAELLVLGILIMVFVKPF